MFFNVAICFPLILPLRLLFCERAIESTFNATSFDTVDLLHADTQHTRNLLIGKPVRLMRSFVTIQQNQCVEDLLAAVSSFRGDLLEHGTLVFRRADAVFDCRHVLFSECSETAYGIYYDTSSVT